MLYSASECFFLICLLLIHFANLPSLSSPFPSYGCANQPESWWCGGRKTGQQGAPASNYFPFTSASLTEVTLTEEVTPDMGKIVFFFCKLLNSSWKKASVYSVPLWAPLLFCQIHLRDVSQLPTCAKREQDMWYREEEKQAGYIWATLSVHQPSISFCFSL